MASFEELEQFHQRLLASGARIAGYSDRQCNVMFLDPDGNELEAIWEPPRELLDRGLVDELRLMLYPVVLGAGKRLFGETGAPVKLELVELRPAGPDGIVILIYRPV